ncbi:hypothetical protein F2Q69_00014284 [Brassica cretica]|uniref:Uncharacterized protein n=1 Tax=Brassica cretica TaxID=69181 RepID=A0A8S9QME7_BRACR|nr:hypothetical protein F2Q69_00014284 [Brassica cretica]
MDIPLPEDFQIHHRNLVPPTNQNTKKKEAEEEKAETFSATTSLPPKLGAFWDFKNLPLLRNCDVDTFIAGFVNFLREHFQIHHRNLVPPTNQNTKKKEAEEEKAETFSATVDFTTAQVGCLLGFQEPTFTQELRCGHIYCGIRKLLA